MESQVANYAITGIVLLIMLVNGIMGLSGKLLPFNGMDKYTDESLSEMAHAIAVPYLIAAGVSIVVFVLNIMGTVSFGAYGVSIVLLLIVFIYHIRVNKRTLKLK